MFELLKSTNYNFLRWQWHWIGASVLLILAGAVSMWMKGGPRWGIDFKGGTLVYVKFAQPVDREQLRAALAQQGLASSTLQRYGPEENNEIIIGTEQVGHEDEALDSSRQAIIASLRAAYQVPGDKLDLNNSGTATLADTLRGWDPLGLAGSPTEAETRYRQIAELITDYRDNQKRGLLSSFAELRSVEGVPPVVVNTLEQRGHLTPFVVRNAEVVGPRVGEQLRQQAMLATTLALAGMLVYIGVRFRQWVYGSAAVIATFHDVLITLGFLSFFDYEFNLNIVAAMLTLVGYSVNDKIVNFDRIRENARLLRHQSFADMVNLSLNQTLSRTILTGLSTLMTLLALFFLGGEVLKGFAFTLVAGIVVGTYSSIFIASPIVVGWIGRGKGRTGTAGPAKVERMPAEPPKVKEAGRKRR
ncbi:MAG: protein translocase subunit SecF [Acidobacteria bacterium]|nr:protein translocase subunit SecF [Acidobacteriota bacterium]